MDRRTFNKMAALAGVGLLTEPIDLLSLRAAAAEGSSEANRGLAAVAIPSEPAYVKSLDGAWRFKLEPPVQRANPDGSLQNKVPASNTAATVEPFQQTQYNEGAEWINLNVPGNWEMAGLSPATYNQPDNAAGLYRLWFDVPESWQGRLVRLAFDGVQNGAEVWLNGEPVAVGESSWNRSNYHESGWTAFQVDLTPQVKFGQRNLLALRVTKETFSADLDSGDYFFLGGIHRPVTLFSVPKTHLSDLTVQTRLLDKARAEVKVLVDVAEGEAATVFMQIDGTGSKTTAKVTNGHAILTQIVEQPKLWSAEFPNLYRLTVGLQADGKVTETVSKRIGIREVTIKNGVLLVNGTPVKLAGICRHDVSPSEGTAVGPDLWRKDITLMKAANINAIRTSHYPYGTGFYDLCDEMGMYVVDELPYCWCNTDDPQMQPAFEQRARETVRRDKNHPCVIVWTIGNENKDGRNLQVIADLVKQVDQTRPRNVSCKDGAKYGTELSDSHYPDVKQMLKSVARARETGRPHILLEQPNTWDIRLAADAGAWERWGLVLQRVWDICTENDVVPGTFLWEWQDRAVADRCPTKPYYYFSDSGIHLLKIKGLVDGFRNPRPWFYDVKMIYSPIQIGGDLRRSDTKVSFPVENRYSFTDLSHVRLAWALETNNSKKALAAGTTVVSQPPLSRRNVDLSLPAGKLEQADALRVEFIHPDGSTIISHRFALKPPSPHTMEAALIPDLPIPQLNLVTRVKVKAEKGWWEKTSYPARLANLVVQPASATKLAELKQLTADIIGGPAGQAVGRVHAEFENGKFTYRIEWTGADADLQEAGWIFTLPASYDRFSWNRESRWTIYHEKHIGRPSGTATPDSMNVPLTRIDRPDCFDFNSTKYDCNWASLTDGAGAGLCVEFDPQRRFHCRGGIAHDRHDHLLFVNQQVSVPDDISRGLVPEFYLKPKAGDVLEGAFRVGSVTRQRG